MGRVFKWGGIVVCGLVVSAALLYTVSRLMPVPDEEAAALAILDAPDPLPGRNGFAAVWLVAYDVPAEQAEDLLDREAARFAATPIPDGDDVSEVFSLALDSLPRLDEGLADSGIDCRSNETGCLDKVRSSLPEYEAQIGQRRKIASRVAALDAYDHFRSPFAPRFDMPLPAYQWLTRNLSVHAHAFVRGDAALALEGVCRDASIARKLVASGDNLIGSMIGAAMMKGASGLFVEMLAELPADQPVPAECGRVFKPDGAMAAGICPTMIGEGRFATGSLRSLGQGRIEPRWSADLLLDVEKTAARGAPNFTWFCGGEARGLIGMDRPLRRPGPPPSRWSLRCASNAIGCSLTDIQSPAYTDYGLRLQDAEARQKLVGSWLWLRDHAADKRPLVERLASRPEALKSAGRDIRVGEGGRTLAIAMYEQRSNGDAWQLPVPEWMAGAPAP